MPDICYSAPVDNHIYNAREPGCVSREEWVELALAALDQAGEGPEDLARFANLLNMPAPAWVARAATPPISVKP